MCCTVVFQYRCGCAERVVFECPFPSTTNSLSDGDLDAYSPQNCLRHYRCHQEKLFAPEKDTVATTASLSHQASSPSLQMTVPSLLPLSLSCSETEKTREQKASETRISKLDDICHDCWQRSLRLAKQKDVGDTTSSATMKDDNEEAEHGADSHILRERSLNEFILPQPSPDRGVVSSAENLSTG
ncbi:hypothetical protein GGS24DRAFT_654 [Hypoxylon argillaceum]|nr:hypothetical protein GGS24DRAFT_654 [Hypoxylon argillaceum]